MLYNHCLSYSIWNISIFTDNILVIFRIANQINLFSLDYKFQKVKTIIDVIISCLRWKCCITIIYRTLFEIFFFTDNILVIFRTANLINLFFLDYKFQKIKTIIDVKIDCLRRKCCITINYCTLFQTSRLKVSKLIL